MAFVTASTTDQAAIIPTPAWPESKGIPSPIFAVARAEIGLRGVLLALRTLPGISGAGNGPETKENTSPAQSDPSERDTRPFSGNQIGIARAGA